MKKHNQTPRNTSAAEALEFALTQVKGIREGKHVLRPGWLYLNTLDEIERRKAEANKPKTAADPAHDPES